MDACASLWERKLLVEAFALPQQGHLRLSRQPVRRHQTQVQRGDRNAERKLAGGEVGLHALSAIGSNFCNSEMPLRCRKGLSAEIHRILPANRRCSW